MKSILPIILVILLLTGAITYVLSKSTLPKEVDKQEAVSPNELEVDSFMTPTPTATPTIKALATPTPTASPTAAPKVAETKSTVPTVTLKDEQAQPEEPTTKGGLKDEDVKIIAKSKDLPLRSSTERRVVCTPVYGAANTCVEHEVVDTAGGDILFLNLAGLSYIAGLGAFVKSKFA